MQAKVSAVDSNREILGQLITIDEDHNNVDLEFDLELGVDNCGARVDFGEHHV
jgi:hypothetical protein